MSKWRPKSCKDCFADDVPISARGLCEPCAITRQEVACRDMALRRGPRYEKWKARMIELGERVK